MSREPLPTQISRLSCDISKLENSFEFEDHNCEFPVHSCHCLLDDNMLRNTKTKNGDASVTKVTLDKKRNQVRQRRDIYDIDNARVTVEVSKERNHSPPTKLVISKHSDSSSEDGRRRKGKPWSTILKENKTESKTSRNATENHCYMTNKGVQCDFQYQPDEVSDPIYSAQSLLKQFKNQPEHDKLITLIRHMEKTLGKINSEIKTTNLKSTKNHFDVSASNFDSTCRQLEEACFRLKTERDCLKQELVVKNQEFQKALMRESDYKKKIDEANKTAYEMTTKFEKYSESMNCLSAKVQELQEESKDLESFKGKVMQMSKELALVSKERDKLRTELELMTLDRDKTRVLLSVKDQELGKLKNEVLMIGKNLPKNEDIRIAYTSINDADLDTTMGTNGSNFFCSSPNSSSSEGPLHNSWQKLSSIVPYEGEKLNLLPSGTRKKKKKKPSSSSPEKPADSKGLGMLKNELKGLFAEMKKQAAMVFEQERQFGGGEVLHPTMSNWSNISVTSESLNLSSFSELS